MTEQERKELIEKLNMALHMRHRSEPYVLTNPEDFQDYLTNVAATYMDYYDYHRTICDVTEELLITIKGSDPVTAALMESGEADYREDLLPVTASDYLMCVELNMGSIVDRAARNLKTALFLLLQSADDVQQSILDHVYRLGHEDAERVIDTAVDNIAHLTNVYNMESNCAVFIEHFKDCLNGIPIPDKESYSEEEIHLGFTPQEEYDRNNPDELQKLFVVTCGRYLNYNDYWMLINDAFGHYDETLEYADPATWATISQGEMEDNWTEDVLEAFRDAEAALSSLAHESEEEFTELICNILSMEPQIQEKVLGKRYEIPEEELDSLMEELFESVYEIGAGRDWPKQAEAFLEVLHDKLGS